jgi:dihydrolipoamide dehydrogenase
VRLTVLGAGPGGYVAALKAAQLGAQVTIVEADEVGGTCLNWGCIPTKTLLSSAEALSHARRLDEFGIDFSGAVSPNIAKIMERKQKVVSTQVKGIRSLLKSRAVTLIEGRGRLTSSRSVQIDKKDGTAETIESDRIVIATGSRPAELPQFKFDGRYVLSSNDAVHINEIPKTLIIIGAGVIGCEFATLFKELGTEVTILEMLPRPVATEDQEISETLERELKKRKIRLMTSVKVMKAEIREGAVHVTLEGGKELSAERLLVSIGRSPNTEGIGLDVVGIERGDRGEIRVNNTMETNVPGVYAIGDVTGGMLLAHKASREGVVAACNACGVERRMDYSVVPAAIFTWPEIGSVGLREHQAAERGLRIRTGHFPFRALGKSHAMGEIAGLFKIVADADTDRVLGVHIIGPHASDLVHEGALAIHAGLTVREVADVIHAHPTLSEGLMECAEDVHGEAIHVGKK